MIQRPINPDGSASMPIGLRSYPSNRLPDAAANVGRVILINDSGDGVPRGRMALSNGASWDRIAFGDEVRQPAQVVDAEPMVRQAVRDMLPALMPKPQPVAFPASVPVALPAGDDMKALAAAMLDMAETINELQRKVHNLEHQVEFLASRAVDTVTLGEKAG